MSSTVSALSALVCLSFIRTKTNAFQMVFSVDTEDPIWDQHFSFNIDHEATEILIKLFDDDELKADDPLGSTV
jgi:Ca2+-dependent lipid-binding protein